LILIKVKERLFFKKKLLLSKSEAIWFDVEEPEIDETEFENMFSKVPLKSGNKSNAKQQNKTSISSSSSTAKQECIKLLDAKRSQAIGILMSSKRLDSQIIREALLSFDNQLLSFETLNSIYMIRPQDDEIKMIQDHIKSVQNFQDDLLDKPELFLLELSRIPAFEERIYCLVYQNRFNEMISSIEFKLNNMSTICDDLMSNEKIKKILGVVLACGNLMNATNKSRGDADGFDLAILPNLKDVKSKDNQTNLLSYIAFFYVNKIDDVNESDGTVLKFPLPDPSDFNFVAQVNFDECEKELRKLNNELKDIQERLDTVLKISNMNGGTESAVSGHSSELSALNDQFRQRVEDFLKNARNECKEQEEVYEKCKSKFKTLVTIYCIKPRASDNEVLPEYFFLLWAAFCQDFKDAWKREKQKQVKQK
jgi:hypothetical protein